MVKELTEQDFNDTINQSKPTIVDFWASWCGPCKMMAPVFEELSHDYKDAEFAKVSTETERSIASQNNITGIPCIIIFKDGKEVDRIVGFKPKDQLKQEIDNILAKN
jgi:thioredoxin 1